MRHVSWILLLALAAPAAEMTPGARAEALFKESETLARQNRAAEAVARAVEGLAELDRAVAAGEKIGRIALDGLLRAAQLARENLLDYDQSLFFCQKVIDYHETDYWRVPARLAMALTWRARGDFEQAGRLYDDIAAGDERYRSRMLLPRAEMVYYDQGDRVRGRQLLDEALRTTAINSRDRFNALVRYAERALTAGRPDEALDWYALTAALPVDKEADRTSFQARAWYEMGRLEETRGRTAEAKALYRQSMQLEGGDMRFRVRARDALEGIEYFE